MKIALSPRPDRALRFRDRGVDVLQRDGRGREQAVGRERAVLRDPVVVGAVAVEHERGIAHRVDRVERPEREREARVEHRRVDAFVVEGLDARGGIPRARVPLGVLPVAGEQLFGVEARRAPEDRRARGTPDAADVPRVLAVGVFGDVVRDQVAPLGAIHAVDPHVGRLHHVSVCVHQHTSER